MSNFQIYLKEFYAISFTYLYLSEFSNSTKNENGSRFLKWSTSGALSIDFNKD